jgi:7,8-dihydropterin-6-yl-methyl-4-(beta-D-ribofuranosyl)aminobenzene 5'-phosphate synthase
MIWDGDCIIQGFVNLIIGYMRKKFTSILSRLSCSCVLHYVTLLIYVQPVFHTQPLAAQSDNRITIITDAFGGSGQLQQDWGYSALIEYNGHRILFDAGNDSAKFAHNVKALGIDLRKLDAVVISHRHGDHIDGLHYLKTVNPGVTIYAPGDEYFGGPTPAAFFRRPDPSLPKEQRYFGGVVPKVIPHGTALRGFHVIRGAGGMELAPSIRLVENISDGPAFSETPELTLVIDTPKGQVVLVGCSHPGIEKILTSVGAPARPVALLLGGLHLLTSADQEVDRISGALKTQWKVQRIAPGHCSGEYTFSTLRRTFQQDFVHAGVGQVIPL